MSREDDLHTIAAARVRAEGQRYTAVRESLVAVLVRVGNPLTIADVLAACPGVPQSSAYRNLAALEQAGVVRRVITDEGFARYELAEDLTHHHHHLICSSCGDVTDFEVSATVEHELESALARVAKRTGFTVRTHRLDLVGTCAACS